MKISNHSEIIGRLVAITNENDILKLKFAIETEVEMAEKAISLSELQQNIGKRVGLFNLNGKFFVREIKKR